MLMNMNAYDQKRHKVELGRQHKIQKQKSNPDQEYKSLVNKKDSTQRMVKWSKDTPTPTRGKATNIH